jgi:hypothetical protein
VSASGAGDGKAYPVALLAAALTLLYPGGGMVMAVLAPICLILPRERRRGAGVIR